MKIFKSLFAAAALTVALTGVSNAAPVARSFSYAPTYINYGVGEGSTGSFGATGNAATTATVKPYFYLTGTLGGTFTINGYGAGVGHFSSQIDIYHNQNVTGTFSGFGDLTDGTNTLEHSITETVLNADGGNIGSVSDRSASDYNSLNQGALTPANSKGHGTVKFDHTVTVGAEDAPGDYSDHGTIIFNAG